MIEAHFGARIQSVEPDEATAASLRIRLSLVDSSDRGRDQSVMLNKTRS
jgi:hypothetical protein